MVKRLWSKNFLSFTELMLVPFWCLNIAFTLSSFCRLMLTFKIETAFGFKFIAFPFSSFIRPASSQKTFLIVSGFFSSSSTGLAFWGGRIPKKIRKFLVLLYLFWLEILHIVLSLIFLWHISWGRRYPGRELLYICLARMEI